MAGLGVAVIVLGVLVYISATTNPFDDADPVITPTEVVPDETVGLNTLFPGDDAAGDGGDDDTGDEPEVLATITLADTVVPGEETGDEEQPEISDNEAVYTVRMVTSWSKQLHPDWYAEGAHFSPMVAWSHRLKNVIFETNTVASDGMEIMAETGAPGTLEEEIQDAQRKGFVLAYSIGKVINALETEMVTLTLSQTAPYASVVSMLAPTPDWFITAHNIKLFDDGQWIERKIVPAVIYDSGTDSGTTFTARDRNTNPADPIALFDDAPIVPVASFEFIKK